MRTAYALLVTLAMAICFSVQAQYKAPSQYFRKDFPAPKPGGAPQQGATKAPESHVPSKTTQPKFKDISTNASFYFMSDTNRAYPWTKVSGTSAKNTKTGATQPINGETPVQR